MICRRPAQLALQALFFLALKPADRPHRVREIAAQLGLRTPYLTKIFQQLQRVGLVRGIRGPRGGVRLARAADQITLWEVIAALEPLDTFEQCALGLPRCSASNPCPLHHLWLPIREQMMSMLQTKNVMELARESQSEGLLPWLPGRQAAGEAGVEL